MINQNIQPYSLTSQLFAIHPKGAVPLQFQEQQRKMSGSAGLGKTGAASTKASSLNHRPIQPSTLLQEGSHGCGQAPGERTNTSAQVVETHFGKRTPLGCLSKPVCHISLPRVMKSCCGALQPDGWKQQCCQEAAERYSAKGSSGSMPLPGAPSQEAVIVSSQAPEGSAHSPSTGDEVFLKNCKIWSVASTERRAQSLLQVS